MKTHRTHWIRWALEYAAIRLAAGLFGNVSAPRRAKLARWFGRSLARWLPFRRREIEKNLRRAFPDLSDSERADLMAEVYVHLTALALEALAMASRSPEQILLEIEYPIEARRRIAELQAEGRGIILVLGHQGNWEWGGLCLAQNGIDLAGLYKPLHNPWTDRYAREVRLRFGLQLVSTEESLKRLVSHLKRGGVVGMVADQHVRRSGLCVEFFGHPAMTATGPAWLACRLGSPLLLMHTHRTTKGKIAVNFGDPIRPLPEAPEEDEVLRLTRAHVAALESAIRLHPDQYFWVHRRWRMESARAGKDATAA